MQPIVAILLAIAGILVLVFLAAVFFFLGVWVRAFMSGARVSLASLIGMKLRRVPLYGYSGSPLPGGR